MKDAFSAPEPGSPSKQLPVADPPVPLASGGSIGREEIAPPQGPSIDTRTGVFADREMQRAALNLMEDAERARRAGEHAAAERARAERALHETQERFRFVVENARDYAIVALALDRKIESWNAGAEAILGYGAKEIIGELIDIIFTPEDRESGVPPGEAQLAFQEGRSSNERWQRRKDGTLFWSSGVTMAMRDHDGKPIGLVKIFRDQTEQLRAREAAEQNRQELWKALQEAERARGDAEDAGRAKDHFLAALSHELRTPLTPILIASHMLARRSDLPAGVSEQLAMIRRNVEAESRMVDDLLDVTRISHGKLEFHQRPVDLHVVLAQAIETIKAEFEAKEQELTVELQAGSHEIEGDAQRLTQVFWNLLKNAAKFTPNGGRISVRTHEEAAQLEIQITDTGIGIEPGMQSSIFDAFTQESTEITRQFGGLGLGLAIAQAIVKGHRGDLRVFSEGSGCGATFTISLPLHAPLEDRIPIHE